jgi:hypothetical protein
MDPTDNSVTLSRALCDMIDVWGLDETKVFVFSVQSHVQGKSLTEYGFTVNPTLEQPTQLADIQYNSKYKSIGFESLCPTVNSIFYHYGIPSFSTKIKLSVEPCEAPGVSYYKILRPL